MVAISGAPASRSFTLLRTELKRRRNAAGRLRSTPDPRRNREATEQRGLATELRQHDSGLGRSILAVPVLVVLNPGEITDMMHDEPHNERSGHRQTLEPRGSNLTEDLGPRHITLTLTESNPVRRLGELTYPRTTAVGSISLKQWVLA